MNKNDDFENGTSGVSVTSRDGARRRGVRPRDRGTRIREQGRPQTEQALPREAARLLDILAGENVTAVIEADERSVSVSRRSRGGISIGAGRFSTQTAEILVRHDVARWERGGSERRKLCITQAGRAYLRRLAASSSEEGFREQHGETVEAEVETGAGERARVRVNGEESPLDWLRRRKNKDGSPMIDDASHQAGERLRADIALAGLLPGVTARWDAVPRGGAGQSPSHATDRMVAARQRIRHAFDAVGGDMADLLLDLCGFLKGLELIERERSWPPRSGKVVVKLALARLAEHYGLETTAHGPKASRGIRTWQAVVIEGGRVV
ncbi:DUF6456 domain-containing protein [Microvirga flavescens]|uniref:DUF6456 domain-containing protein n=1 Tax=Microvirga flavescens TaxID=2249811 RepID=UPI001FDFA4DC|nr:DUF6456 domain-containing protein [Microvirga flavescens]